jgi:hypothetical protein
VQIVGTMKAYWQEEIEEEDETIEGMDDLQIAQLMQQVEASENLEVVAHSETEVLDEAGLPVALSHDVTIRRTINKSRVVLENIPPEEFVVSADARSLEDARMKSHRTIKTVGELIDMGFDREVVESLPTFVDHEASRERQARESATGNDMNEHDPMMREVAVHQGIIRCDYDGTGIKDWYFTAGGNGEATELLEIVEYDYQVVFADFCPNPLPHLFFGRCPADELSEIQKIKTVLTRQMLDNLYLSNTPQREVVSNLIERVEDLATFAPGAPILVKQPGAIREIGVPFMAQHALTALQYFGGEAEARTGISRASMGLDPEVLQNQSATAANIANSAAQGKVEMIARIWAQTGLRKLYRGIFHILKRYQDFPRIVRVGSTKKTVDPRAWEMLEDADVVISTGLGTGTRERDLAMLAAIANSQKEVLLTMGPNNPMVSLGQYVHTQRKMVEAAGLPDPDQFWREIPDDFQMPQQEPQADPKMMEAQAKMQMEGQKLQAEMQLQREKMAQELEMQREKIRMEHEAMMARVEMERQAALEKLSLERDLKFEEMKAEAALEAMKMAAGSADGQGNIPTVT